MALKQVVVENTYGVMGIFDRIRDPKIEGVAPSLWVAPTVLTSPLPAVGVSSTNRRNCVLFMFRTGGPAM